MTAFLFDPLTDVGEALWRHLVIHAYMPDTLARPLLAWPLLGMAVLAAALMIYRQTEACAELAITRPRLFRRLHGPNLVPFGMLLGAVGLALIAPGAFSEETAYRTLTGCLVAVLGSIGVMAYRAGRDGKNHDKGSARWAKWKAVAIHPTWRWSIPLRVSFRGAMTAWIGGAGKTVLAPSNGEATRHALLVGQTGSGKGYTVFSAIIASSRVPFAYQDVKGQCPGHDSVRARFGKDPIRWGCAAQDGWPSMGWNPMEECRRDARPTDAFNALAAALIPGRTESDWVAELTRPILAHVLEHGGHGCLGEVQDAVMGQGLDAVLAAAQVPPGLLAALEGKNVREYIGTTLFSALSPFQSGWGRMVTSTHDFSLSEVCRTCTYVLSAEPEVTRRTPITVFWQLLLRRLLQSSEPVPLTLLFDEALAAGKIPSVRDALVTLRDRHVSIIFGTQHLSGLREVYGPTEGDSLIASFTSRILLLNGLDPRDRDWLVKSLGQRTIHEKKHKSVTTTAIPLMTLDDLGRRASSAGVFWAVIDGPGMTRTGEPIIARMIGGPKNLIRQPSAEERAAFPVPAPAPARPVRTPLPLPGVDLDEL
jgi:hypothetical protein